MSNRTGDRKTEMRTVVVLVDQWDPVLHESTEDANERRVCNLVRKFFQFRPGGTEVPSVR